MASGMLILRRYSSSIPTPMRTSLPPNLFLKSASVAILVLATALSARADNVLVDTGAGTSSGYLVGGEGYYSISQNLASQFTLSQSVTVTSLEGWIRSYNADYLHIAITDNSNGIIPGTEIWGDDLLLDGSAVNAWQGFTNMNLFLSAGTYWIAFVGSPSLTAIMDTGVPNPLGNEAFAAISDGNWYPYWGLDIGVRIKGNSVPDGASVVGLLGLAFGAMLMVRRRLN